MLRENTNDLLAFMAVARERSFTRAAAKLGVSRSALSHTIRNLEERLGLRLLARTTRMRLPTHDTIFEWEFEKQGRSLNMRVDGPAVVNTLALRLNAALDGVGLAYMPEDYAMPHIEAGRLVRVLEDWCDPYPGYHLFYPSRRQMTPAFALLVEALRYRA